MERIIDGKAQNNAVPRMLVKACQTLMLDFCIGWIAECVCTHSSAVFKGSSIIQSRKTMHAPKQSVE